MFLIDSSSSMGYRDFRNVKTFVKYVTNELDVTEGTARIGLITYSASPKLEFGLNSYQTTEELVEAVDNVRQRYGNTNTAAALRGLRELGFVEENGDRSDVPNVAVLITDGKPNVEVTRTLPEAQSSKEAGIHIYGFGVRLRNYPEFNNIMSDPKNSTVKLLPNFEELVAYGPEFVERLCTGSLSNTCATLMSYFPLNFC